MKYTILAFLCSSSVSLCYDAGILDPHGLTRISPRLSMIVHASDHKVTPLRLWKQTSTILEKWQSGELTPQIVQLPKLPKITLLPKRYPQRKINYYIMGGLENTYRDVNNFAIATSPGLGSVQQFAGQRFSLLQRFIQTPGILEKCQNDREISNILSILNHYLQESLTSAIEWVESSSILNKCQNGGEIFNILVTLKNYPQEKLIYATEWMQRSKVWDKCQNGDEISLILWNFKDYSEEELVFATKWIESSGTLNKCQNGIEISNTLRIFKNYPQEKLIYATKWMQRSEAWDKCQNGDEISNILWKLKDYSEEELIFATNWIESSGALNKCQNGDEISLILRIFKNYPQEELTFVTNWIKNSGILDKCRDGKYIFRILEELKDYPNERLIFVTEWMKRSGAWDKCQNAAGTINILRTLKNYPNERLTSSTNWLERSGALNLCRSGTIISHLLKGLKSLDIRALSSTKYELPIEEDFLPIYIIGATLDTISEKCKEALQSFIENLDTRVSTLNKIDDILGEESAVTQEFLLLALGYDNSDDPDGFLAVYQEMMQKREELVRPPLKTQTPGVILNIDRVQEPRATAPIHMPLNVWTRLFDSFKTVERDTLAALYGDVNYNSLLDLETNQNITALLDPKDSLVTKDRVSSHSFMLRDVLKRIQTLHQINFMAAIASFSQLLVNMTTCPTGKLNGITHTYLLMNKDTVLDEGELGSTAFIQGIIHHFNEELRRFREGTLSAMVKGIVKDAYADPHDVLYVRGIIGGDVGLLFAGEIPKIDMNANMVSPILRQMSKQDLLNLFYQYYTVEEVITLFHTKLNNGSFKIEDLSSSKNLTLLIINDFLRDDAFDVEAERYNPDYIVLDPSGKPVGLTPTAAKKLLLQMGFLTAVPQ